MALQIANYVDPGVYIGELISPNAVNVATTPMQVGLIGIGDRTKRISNELVQRGAVADEPVTWNAPARTASASAVITGPSTLPVGGHGVPIGLMTLDVSAGADLGALASILPGTRIVISGATNGGNNSGPNGFVVHDRVTSSVIRFVNSTGTPEALGASATWSIRPFATLVNRGTRALQNTTAFKNGVALGDNFIGYQPAMLQSTAAGSFDMSTATGTNWLGMALDGKAGVSINVLQGQARLLASVAGAAGGQVAAPLAVGLPAVASRLTLTFDAGWDPAQPITITGTTVEGGVGDIEVFTFSVAGLYVGVKHFLGTPTLTYQYPAGAGGGFVSIGTFEDADLNGETEVAVYVPLFPYTSAVVSLGGTAKQEDVANAINTGLRNLTDTVMGLSSGLGYGTGYASVASGLSGTMLGVQLASPTTTPSADVVLMTPVADKAGVTGSGNTLVFGGETLRAASVLYMSRLKYTSTATYTVDYVRLDEVVDEPPSRRDTLARTGVLEILRVGTFAGTANFTDGTDYQQVVDAIDWTLDQPASFTGSQSATYDVSLATLTYKLALGFDGKSQVTIDLSQLGTGPHGWTVPVAPAAATAAEVCANINAVMANHGSYGLLYRAVASKVTVAGLDYIRLTSPLSDQLGSVAVGAPTNRSANLEVLGLTSSQVSPVPYTVIGSGRRPSVASGYFVTYSITRPTTDYNLQKRFFTLDSLKADLGPTTSENPLVMAAELAFANNAPSLVVVQVNDSSLPGTPTRAQFQSALNALKRSDLVTDIIALSTSLDVQIDVKDHVENESSAQGKHYRRAWFGLARSTDIGDKDTAGTYVYMARRTLQVAPDSPGRGRYMLVAPPQLSGVSRDITLEDGSTETVLMDSTYLGVAWAARKASLQNPALSLAMRSVVGFNTVDVSDEWEPAERGTLAGQGVFVTTYDAGNFKCLDPVTTEAGGGGLAAFGYESTSSQKDNLRRKIDQALNLNIVGVVPSDLVDFIVDIKSIISSVIIGEVSSGTIGPFRSSSGQTRPLVPATDIDVQQSPTDPTKFFFTYTFNLRYPALRLFGEFTVDNPFASV